MHLMDNIFLLRSFMNTYDTLFLMACAINPLTCVYADDLLVFCFFFFPASPLSRAYVGDTEL